MKQIQIVGRSIVEIIDSYRGFLNESKAKAIERHWFILPKGIAMLLIYKDK